MKNYFGWFLLCHKIPLGLFYILLGHLGLFGLFSMSYWASALKGGTLKAAQRTACLCEGLYKGFCMVKALFGNIMKVIRGFRW